MKRQMRRTLRKFERGISQVKSYTTNLVRSQSTRHSYNWSTDPIPSTLPSSSSDSNDDDTSNDGVFEPAPPLESSAEDLEETSITWLPCEFCLQLQSSSSFNRHQLRCSQNPARIGRRPTNRQRSFAERGLRRTLSDSVSPPPPLLSPSAPPPPRSRSPSPTEGFPKPPEFLCPITHELFHDPVVASDGHTYERKAISRWLQQGSTSPVTREHMSKGQLIPNRVVKSCIERFRAHCRRLKKLYKYKLDVDIRKTDQVPYRRTSAARSVYRAEWIGDHKNTDSNVELIQLMESEAESILDTADRIGPHPNIIRIYGGVRQEPATVFLIQEATPTQTLSKFMTKPPEKLSISIVDTILCQIVSALQFLKNADIVHGHVTPDNVFVCQFDGSSENLLVKLSNICSHERQLNGVDGTTTAITSSVSVEDTPSELSDLCGFGKIAQKLYSMELEFDDQISSERQSLIERCFETDPKGRATFDELSETLKSLLEK